MTALLQPRSCCLRPGPSRQTTPTIVCGKSFFGQLGSHKYAVNATNQKYAIKRLTLEPPTQRANVGASAASVLQQRTQTAPAGTSNVEFQGVHHVALLVKDLERSMAFYTGTLGLTVNPDRPHHKLPYRGAWLWLGPEMIHLMELPDPDPKEGRPTHGGRDRHFCIGVRELEPLAQKLEAAKVPFTRSMSGRPALFFRDPDMNCLECAELESWR